MTYGSKLRVLARYQQHRRGSEVAPSVALQFSGSRLELLTHVLEEPERNGFRKTHMLSVVRCFVTQHLLYSAKPVVREEFQISVDFAQMNFATRLQEPTDLALVMLEILLRRQEVYDCLYLIGLELVFGESVVYLVRRQSARLIWQSMLRERRSLHHQNDL